MHRCPRILRLLLIEARDWLFALGALIAVAAIGTLTDGSWWLAIPTLVVFAVLYVLAVFASSRLVGESERDAMPPDPTT